MLPSSTMQLLSYSFCLLCPSRLALVSSCLALLPPSLQLVAFTCFLGRMKRSARRLLLLGARRCCRSLEAQATTKKKSASKQGVENVVSKIKTLEDVANYVRVVYFL